MVLDIHERTIAEQEGRKPRDISTKDVLEAIKEADKNKDGKISKEEMQVWVIKFMNTF